MKYSRAKVGDKVSFTLWEQRSGWMENPKTPPYYGVIMRKYKNYLGTFYDVKRDIDGNVIKLLGCDFQKV